MHSKILAGGPDGTGMAAGFQLPDGPPKSADQL